MSDQPHEQATHPVALLCLRFADRLDALVDPGDLTLWSATDGEVAEIVRAAELVIRKAVAVQTTAVGEAARRDLAKTVGRPRPPAGWPTCSPPAAPKPDRSPTWPTT